MPVCRCELCKKRFRVLPVEIAPFKSYTRAVMETACVTYLVAQEPRASLRQTVRRIGAGHPDHCSLHGWLGGLGARALGRLDRRGMGPPVAALIAESSKRLDGELLSYWTQRHPILPDKFRGPERHERLEACLRVFQAARRLFPQHPYAWSAWESWLQSRFHVTAWGFPARLACTAIQQHGLRRVGVQCASSIGEPNRRTKGYAHGARSPP